MNEGDIAIFFVKGSRTGASTESVSRPIDLKRGHILIGIYSREKLPGASRHVCTKFPTKIRRTDCVGPIKFNA